MPDVPVRPHSPAVHVHQVRNGHEGVEGDARRRREVLQAQVSAEKRSQDAAEELEVLAADEKREVEDRAEHHDQPHVPRIARLDDLPLRALEPLRPLVSPRGEPVQPQAEQVDGDRRDGDEADEGAAQDVEEGVAHHEQRDPPPALGRDRVGDKRHRQEGDEERS